MIRDYRKHQFLRADYDSLTSYLWAIRRGRCRTDISFDMGLFLGYLAALNCHFHVSAEVNSRLRDLAANAQTMAMAVTYDLEAQGWTDQCAL